MHILRHGYIVAAAAASQSSACGATRNGEVTQDRDDPASPPLPVGPRIDASPPLPECPRSSISGPCPADQLLQDYFDTESTFGQPYAPLLGTIFGTLKQMMEGFETNYSDSQYEERAHYKVDEVDTKGSS